MKTTRTLLLAVAASAALTLSAQGEGAGLDLKNINFDLWCQETQHLPPDRCDKRLPSDEADFEAYRDKVEKYEVPYEKGQQSGAQLNRIILRGDPVAHPVTQDPSAAQQEPVSPVTPPRP